MEASLSATFEPFLARVREAVDAELRLWLQEAQWPADFESGLRHTLEGAGKAVRPALIFAIGESFGDDGALSRPSTRRLALAIELLHTYSLVHDDLPAMDDDAFRRGRPTLHVLHGEAFAILAGDAMLTASFECLAAAFAREPEKLPRAVAILSRAAGAAGMIGGQWLDVGAEVRGKQDVGLLEKIHRQKTGALLSACGRLGALKTLGLARFDAIESELDGWGENFGLLFQMVDDLLDATSTRGELGKSPGKDSAQGKLTYLSRFTVEQLRALIEAKSRELNQAAFAVSSERLQQLTNFVTSRKR